MAWRSGFAGDGAVEMGGRCGGRGQRLSLYGMTHFKGATRRAIVHDDRPAYSWVPEVLAHAGEGYVPPLPEDF